MFTFTGFTDLIKVPLLYPLNPITIEEKSNSYLRPVHKKNDIRACIFQ